MPIAILCLFCQLFFLCPAWADAAPPAAQTSVDLKNLDPAWQRRFWEWKAVENGVNAYLEELPEDHNKLRAVLVEAQRRSVALLAQAPLSQKDPVARAALVQRLQRQEAIIRRALEPMQEAAIVIRGYAEALRQLTEALTSAEKLPPSALTKALPSLFSEVRQTGERLQTLEDWMALVRDPALQLADQLAKERERVRAALPSLWRSYYLHPFASLLEPALWQGWTTLLQPYLQSGYWRDLLLVSVNVPRLLLHWLLLGIPLATLAWFLDRRGRSLRLWRAHRRALLPGFMLFLAGGSLLLTLHGLADASSPLLTVPAWLACLGGQARLAWAGHLQEEDFFPWPLLAPVPAGLWLLALTLPPLLLTLCWLAVLACCLLWLLLHLRRYAGRDRPLRILYTAALAALFLGSCLGWVRLSILICVLLAGLYTLARQWRGAVRLASLLPLPAEGSHVFSGSLLLSCFMPGVAFALVGLFCLWPLSCPGITSFLSDLHAAAFEAQGIRIHWMDVALLAGGFYFVYALSRISTRLLDVLIRRHANMDRSVIPTLQAVLTCCLWMLFAFCALGLLGMDVKSLAFIGGGLSVGIGFGLQHIISNFFSGLVLIFSRTIRGGDLVEIGGVTGRVRSISVRSTVVMSVVDSAMVMVPNVDMLTSKLTNWTGLNRHIRKDIPVGVAYGSDPRQVMDLLLLSAAAQPKILGRPAPQAVFRSFGDSTLNFSLRVWIEDVDSLFVTLSDLLTDINARFNAHNVVIAFPQLDVHIQNWPPPGKDAPRTPQTTA